MDFWHIFVVDVEPFVLWIWGERRLFQPIWGSKFALRQHPCPPDVSLSTVRTFPATPVSQALVPVFHRRHISNFSSCRPHPVLITSSTILFLLCHQRLTNIPHCTSIFWRITPLLYQRRQSRPAISVIHAHSAAYLTLPKVRTIFCCSRRVAPAHPQSPLNLTFLFPALVFLHH